MKRVYQIQCDTCSCVRCFMWDGDRPQDPPEPIEAYDLTIMTSRCDIHAHLKDPVELWNTVKEENTRKNAALVKVAEICPGVTRKDDPDHEAIIDGKRVMVARIGDGAQCDEALVKWSFDRDRNLVIDAPTLTATERNAVNVATAARVTVR